MLTMSCSLESGFRSERYMIIVKVLNCFHLASGLKINIAKSQVLGVGVSPECCCAGGELGSGADWSCLNRSWGLPIYYIMSIFKVPKGVLKTMESIRSKFFNGVDSSDRKISWVAWDNVLASKLNGGLGVLEFLRVEIVSFVEVGVALLFLAMALYFPLFVCSRLDKEIVVDNKMELLRVSASFRRAVRDGAARTAVGLDLLLFLNSVVLCLHDRWTCYLSGDGEFQVKVHQKLYFDDLFSPFVGC
ncbi:hypothetical protein Tco_1067157 [Tanacetum coccineum]|uniref:Uncharacterized protein n=1 Tax=Tanacetum coccineum TaxID=301880 RepID=A0ABQ5HDV4_9ASTR